MSIESSDIEEYVLKPFCYLYNEYVRFADELTRVLIEQLPWLANVLDRFATIAPVYFSTGSGVTRAYYTIDRAVLSMYIYDELGRIKDKIPTPNLDPVIEVIRENMPALFMMETLGRAIGIGFFSPMESLASEFKFSMGELRKAITGSERKRRKLLNKVNESIKNAETIVNILRETLEEEDVPNTPPPRTEILDRVRYVKRVDGSISDFMRADGLLIYALRIYGIYYPLKFALLNGYLLLKTFPDDIMALKHGLEEGGLPDEESFLRISTLLGLGTYLSPLSDHISSARIRYGTTVDMPEAGDGAFKVFENIIKNYSKIRGKREIKAKDLRETLYKIVAYIC